MNVHGALAAFFAAALALVGESLHEKENGTIQRQLATISTSDSASLPVTGLLFPTASSDVTADYMPPSLQEELIEALETDEQVTVIGDIQVGVLDCESLEGAEDAATLVVAISADELIRAEKTSYTFISGDAFEDGIARKVWVGEEVVDDTTNPRRTVSITWGEVCNAETFLLKVTTTETEEEAISVVKSIPCIPDASTDLCVVETEVTPEEEDDPDPVSTDSSVQDRALRRATRSRQGSANSVMDIGHTSRKKRQLQSTTSVNLMYLYTEGGKDVLGGISDTQMQTTLATALATANEAMTNSGIDLVLSLVHVGSLPYDETSTSAATVLDNLTNDGDVADLRDTYEADLVQLAANLGFSCGRGHLYTGDSVDGFSTVNPICLDNLSHTHEMGHNLGCYHNREDSTEQTDYAHGYRYCDTTDPYRTIMSYLCSNDYTVPRLNWFSNPDVDLLNKATGTSDNDCARAIEENMVTVSEFRPVEVLNSCLDSTNTDYRCSGRNSGETIDLRACGLTDSDAGLLRACFEVVDITAITKIKLNVNSFTYLPYDLFDGIDAITVLNLQNNCGLTCVPPVPAGTNVYLSSCSSGISTCALNACLDSTDNDYRCSGRNSGETIDLRACGLTDTDVDSLRACFEVVDITAITKIKLNVNSFTYLPYDLFDGIDAMTILNLQSNCGLTCVPPVPSGTNVYLSSCSSGIGTCDS